MSYIYGQEKPPLDEAIEHYGIKGMRWGVRRTPEQLARARGERLRKGKSVTPTKAVAKVASQLKTANKARDADIKNAREQIPELKKKYKSAKKEYKVQRKEVGRKEAKKSLKPVQQKLWDARELGSKKTSGEALASIAIDIVSANKLQDIRTQQVVSKTTLNDAVRRAERERELRSRQQSRSGS